MRSLSWSSLLALAGVSSALHLPIQRIRPRSSSGSTYMSGKGSIGLGNTNNILYTAEVKTGNKSYTLLLDTGSSDLWFAPDKDYNQTFADATLHEDLKLNLTYGTGWSAGVIAQTDVEFADFSIKNQSFLFIEELSGFDVEFAQQFPAYQGIVGLSFDTLSAIANTVFATTNSTWGRSLMSNIFLSNPPTPNHIAFFLDRTGDLNETDVGYFDIGTYAAGYEGVSSMPKHGLFTGYGQQVRRWNLLLHGLSINGQSQTLNSSVLADNSTGYTVSPPRGTVSALLDTGSSAAVIPEEAFHALYKGMGGVLMNDSVTYAVPCLAEAEVMFTFGNQSIVVHPLDLTSVEPHDFGNGQNLTLCTNSYGPAAYSGGDNDITLGDSFLRNVYAVYNYGGLVGNISGFAAAGPFIQILPLTDSKEASAEFKQARAKTLAALPAQVDIATVSDPIPKSLNEASSSSGSNTASRLNAGSSNAELSVASTSGPDGDAVASLSQLAALAPVAVGLLGSSVGLLVVLIAISVMVLVQLKTKVLDSRKATYVPVPFEREGAVDYRGEPTKYDTPFRD